MSYSLVLQVVENEPADKDPQTGIIKEYHIIDTDISQSNCEDLFLKAVDALIVGGLVL